MQLGVNARSLHPHVLGGEAVAEAGVDGLLRRPQGGERFAAVANVVELRSHHPTENPLAAVRREHAHDGHPRARKLGARHGELEREDAGPADDRVPVEGCMSHDPGVVEHIGTVGAVPREWAGGLVWHLAGGPACERVRHAERGKDRGRAADTEDPERVTPCRELDEILVEAVAVLVVVLLLWGDVG